MLKKEEAKTINKALAILESNLTQYGVQISEPEIAVQFLKLNLSMKKSECFGVMYLNAKHQLISFDILFHGTIDGASVYPREVVRGCIEHNAAAVIFTHNHPSGHAEPSSADITITNRLSDILDVIDVRTLDHIIIAGNSHSSLASAGHI